MFFGFFLSILDDDTHIDIEAPADEIFSLAILPHIVLFV